MAVTTKLSEEANALLEIYLGWKRARLERIDKEDAVAAFVCAGVRTAIPADILDLLVQGTPLAQPRSVRSRRSTVRRNARFTTPTKRIPSPARQTLN